MLGTSLNAPFHIRMLHSPLLSSRTLFVVVYYQHLMVRTIRTISLTSVLQDALVWFPDLRLAASPRYGWPFRESPNESNEEHAKTSGSKSPILKPSAMEGGYIPFFSFYLYIVLLIKQQHCLLIKQQHIQSPSSCTPACRVDLCSQSTNWNLISTFTFGKIIALWLDMTYTLLTCNLPHALVCKAISSISAWRTNIFAF
jgi:hypothetical protein